MSAVNYFWEGMQPQGHVHIRAGGSLWLKASGEVFFGIWGNERGTYFQFKDLCMIEHIPDLLEAGIDSFKIEDV